MDSVWIPGLLGLIIIVMGLINWKGNLSLLHWYHRHRVSEENRPVFGRLVGAGTMLIGAAMVVFSLLSFAGDRLQNAAFATVGSAVLVAAVIIGTGISFYAMFKYNKGIF